MSYLFWEAKTANVNPNQLFLDNFVRRKNSIYCFNSTDIEAGICLLLTNRGLNSKESYDLISYWLKDLTSKPYVAVSFLENKIYEELAVLNVEPKPKKLIRLFMLFNPINNPIEEVRGMDYEEIVKRDEYESTVVEWGAMNLSEFS